MPLVQARVARMLSPLLVVPLLLAAGICRAEPQKFAAPARDNADEPRRIAFEMRDKPWNSVLEWLCDQTGMAMATTTKPTGTLTFIDSGNRKYTIPEIVDLLNEQLLAQKLLLIRRDRFFTIVAADEKIPPELLPRIELSELDRRGSSELAQIVLPLKSLVAEDEAVEIKKMMGPLGDAAAMAKANQLVLTDTVGNLRRICKLIKDYEEAEGRKAESLSHVCLYVKAREAERMLRDLLGDPKDLLRANQPAPAFAGFSGDDSNRFGPMPRAATAAKVRMHYISCDERTNTVLVTGPADKIAQAREILRTVDAPQKGQQAIVVGPPFLKTYTVPTGNAELLAKTLQEIYKSAPGVRIVAAGTGAILVWGTPEDQIDIAKHIVGNTESGTRAEKVPLNALDAAQAIITLKGMFSEPKNGGPYLEADASANAILIHGTAQQIAEVKGTLRAIGENGSASNLRIITINQGGSAVAVAEVLQRLLPQLCSNPVKVVIPGSASKAASAPNKLLNPADRSGDEEEEQAMPGAPAAPSAPEKAVPGNVDQRQPITISVVGNRLLVTSEDAQALALVQEMVRLLTQSPGSEGDFEIIRLKNASASEAAKVLDEAFNGTKLQSAGQAAPFFGRFGAPGAQPPAAPSENRIRVVADPISNSLLVRASPVDMLTVHRLLDRAIDVGKTDSRAVSRTWIVGPLRYASAAEIAGVVREVYREHMSTGSVVTQIGGFGGGFPPGEFGGIGAQPSASVGGTTKPIDLSIGVDDRSNSLILNCSSALRDDVKQLAERLDESAKNSRRTVRVIAVNGISPLLVQQAIDAIQGHRTRPSSESGDRDSGPRFNPAGMNGFAPGGVPGGSLPGRGNGGRSPGASPPPASE
jgi:type II secretory pathway component GspD/PulD (secretin)